MKLSCKLLLMLLLFAAGVPVQAQSTNGNGNPSGRDNWFPNRGNVGIGTRSPSESLEVIGNVKVSQTVTTNDLETVGLSATNVSVSQNASIGGNLNVTGKVGIGVANPVEKLEVGGNLKVTQTIFGDALTVRLLTSDEGTVNNNLNVGQNFIVNGLSGFGVASPGERIDVNGNVRATQRFLGDGLTVGDGAFSRGVNIGQNLTVDGNLGVGVPSPTEKIDVLGNVKSSQRFLGDGLTVGDGLFSRGVQVDQNIIGNGNLGLGVPVPSERVDIAGNIKASQRVLSDGITSGDGIFSRGLQVEQNIISNGNIGVGVASPTERFEVAGNMKGVNGLLSGELQVGQNALVSGSVGVGTTSPTEKLDVTGNIKSSGDLIGQNVRADKAFFNSLESNGNLTINGNVGIGTPAGTDKLTVGGNARVTGLLTAENLTVNQTLDISGVLSLGGSLGIGVANPESPLHVSGDGKFEGDIRANKIIVNAIEIAGSTPTPGSGSVSLGDNLVVNGSIGIGTNKVNGYRLSVNGKIRASDDIRVYLESDWSDFVFEKDYKLRSLEELDAYIVEHGHLPEIPSAAEVKKEGYDMGAMDAKLLQKIEELTLYVVAQQKEIESLKRQVKKGK